MEPPFSHAIHQLEKKFTDTFGVRFHAWPLFIVGLVLLVAAFVVMPALATAALGVAFFLAPVWLPILIFLAAWRVWVTLKRGEFIWKQKYILLEIKPPRNLVKTPLAMETFLAGIHLSPGETTWYAKWILGGVRPWWSLELASFGGQVHFYIWTRSNFRRIVESQMYAQYPGVQIVEAPDYTRLMSASPHDYTVWGCDYKHTATDEDPLPIKTYVEFGLDKVQKEPEQVDPIANLIEFLGSVGKGENVWLQFVIRVHKGEKYHKKNKGGQIYTWKDRAAEMIEKIRSATRDPYIDPVSGEERPGFPNPTKGQLETLAAIDRNVSKLAFDVGVRCVYISEPDKFNPIIITHMIGLFKPFSTEGWNGIKATAWLMNFNDYPWEIWQVEMKAHYASQLVEAYRRRQFFHDPFGHGMPVDDIMVMSTEELATLFHIPSSSVETPGLGRMSSATGEAPANLPT